MIMGLYDLAVTSLFNGCLGFCFALVVSVYTVLLICFSFDYVECLFCCFSGSLGWVWAMLNDYA